MSEPAPLPRVRVTAPVRGAGAPRAARVEPPPSEAENLFVRSLIRSQLRLALACAFGFVALLALFTIVLGVLPELDAIVIAGVPLSWLLLGFGVYPLIVLVGALYVRVAGRNEARYRSLTDDS
ncbi:hypothetical protein [Agromyces atrinae]|uniref:DUF485 domain-containing protein n=1 Tax=Agromyces atrinae TaxID=592376 RepID=A0A4Q2M695_9MICO|nr:hypothetical protein [Agromyces atrinae]NYD68173.1 hypothetical protein [Agromyces atrinae]RXZ87685.1 hypothetical protein ESP50_00305 [Agromyces atrinae]